MPDLLHRKIWIALLLGLFILSFPQSNVLSGPASASGSLPQFTNVSAAAKINTALESWGANWGDYNNDGWLDVVTYCHDYRTPELFRNNADGTFTNAAAETPLSTVYDRHAATWGDYDNDGDQDLYTGIGGQAGTGDHPKELFNIQHGTLTDVAESAGVKDGLARNRAASWADYDRDGYLDLFVANHEREGLTNRLWRNNGDGTFTNMALEAGVADNMGMKYASFVDYDRDGWPDIFILGITKNLLYHNLGDGTFVDVAAGTALATGGFDTYAWGDYDNDGLADLFVTSSIDLPTDYQAASSNQVQFSGLAAKDQDGLDFVTASSSLTVNVELLGPDDCRTKDCIFIGADGHHPTSNPFTLGAGADGMPAYTPGSSLGYYFWRDSGTNQWHVRMSTPDTFKYGGVITSTAPVTNLVPVDIETDIPVGKTMLWHNQGNGLFVQRELEAGVALSGNFRSTNWIDFDNDGFLDLFIINQGNLMEGNLPDVLFHNNRDGTFTNVAQAAGVTGTTIGEGSVSAWADYDRNGFLDLFTTNGNNNGSWLDLPYGPNELFHNEGNSNHWIQLKLVGLKSNRSGLGAVVRVAAGGIAQLQTMDDGLSAYNQYGNPLHFGLGASTSIDSIDIRWPSGTRQILRNVSADQFLTITEEANLSFDFATYLPLIQK